MTEPNHRLKLARERAGLSLGQAARILGLHREELQAIEAGAAPGEPLMSRLAGTYRVNIPWLCGEVPIKAEESALASVVCPPNWSRVSQHDKDEILTFMASLPERAP